MSIKASPTEPTKKELSRNDSTGDTWVMITQITYRQDMIRGELLKQREVTDDVRRGQQTTGGLNLYALWAEELWLTYHSCHIVLEGEEGDTTEPFKPVEEMTRQGFLDALGQLPSDVVIEWHEVMVVVNPDWFRPF